MDNKTALPKSKVEAHVQINKLFSQLQRICALLELPRYHEQLARERHFLSVRIDNSDLPSV